MHQGKKNWLLHHVNEVCNRSLLSSKNSPFQKAIKVQNLSCEKEIICMRTKNNFHINSFTLSLTLKQRLGQLRNGEL